MASSEAVRTIWRDNASTVQGFTFELADVVDFRHPNGLEWKKGKEVMAVGSKGHSKTHLHACSV